MTIATHTTDRPAISLETLLYGGLVVLVLLWRLVGLGDSPLSHAEAHEALAAYQPIAAHLPQTGADTLYPLNPLGRFFNIFALTVMGGSDFAARFPTALVSALLVLTPLLYRRWVGRNVALAMAIGLALSPVSLMAGRTLSGMVWAMGILLLLGWAVGRYAETENRGFSLLAMLCLGGILFLTTPMGILLMLVVICGVLVSTGGRLPNMSGWAWGEGALATLLGAVIISTVFFTLPSGLSSVSAVLDAFWSGILTSAQPNFPRGYALLVSWRYEWFLWLFSFIWLWLYARESTSLERFLAGWWVSAVVLSLLYAGTTADFALAFTLPMLGLTVSLMFRLLQSTAFGFWHVPAWVIPLHGLAVAGLLASLSVSLLSQSEVLFEEARLVDYAKVLQVGYGNTEQTHIGTLRPDAGGSSMALSLPLIRLRNCQESPSETNTTQDTLGRYCEEDPLWTITVQVVPLDEGVKDAEFSVHPLDTEPTDRRRLGDGLLFTYTAETEGEYRLDLLKSDGQNLTENAQYLVIVLPDDVLDDSILEGISSGGAWTGIPHVHAGVTISLRALRGWAFVLMLMILLLIPMTFFLVGAFYGGRAAWRGLAFGVLIFSLLHGFGIAWQAITLYAGQPRELWYAEPVTSDYATLAATLAEYSKRSTGTVDEMAITVQGDSDGALGWALRSFHHVTFVNQLDVTVNTPAVVAPDVQPRPELGAEYVGQELVWDYYWDYGWLNWTDWGEWWFKRQTRFEPIPINTYRVWIEKTVYDVETVPEDNP